MKPIAIKKLWISAALPLLTVLLIVLLMLSALLLSGCGTAAGAGEPAGEAGVAGNAEPAGETGEAGEGESAGAEELSPAAVSSATEAGAQPGTEPGSQPGRDAVSQEAQPGTPDQGAKLQAEPAAPLPEQVVPFPGQAKLPALPPAQVVLLPEPPPAPGPADKPLSGESQSAEPPSAGLPSGDPRPGEEQNSTGTYTCTLSVRCDLLLDNMENLKENKLELVPADGVIFPAAEVTFYEGESVFNVLQREMKAAKIHLEFRNTPVYESAYIMGIHNLYEFDCGELSGWMYKVNGEFPNYGCSRYLLSGGDVIEWHYTCDLGRDLDAGWVGGIQQ